MPRIPSRALTATHSPHRWVAYTKPPAYTRRLRPLWAPLPPRGLAAAAAARPGFGGGASASASRGAPGYAYAQVAAALAATELAAGRRHAQQEAAGRRAFPAPNTGSAPAPAWRTSQLIEYYGLGNVRGSG